MLEADMLHIWLQNALKKSGLSQADLMRRLNDLGQQTYYTSTINNMVKGRRKISADELITIEEITGVPAPNNQQNWVPVLGKVAAGSTVTIQDTAQGPFEVVEGPPNAETNTYAAEIDGDCLGTMFNGWHVFWNDPPSPPSVQHMNTLCMVWLDDGRILLKRINRGTLPGVYKLESQFEPPLYDQVVKLVAPVIAIMPKGN